MIIINTGAQITVQPGILLYLVVVFPKTLGMFLNIKQRTKRHVLTIGLLPCQNSLVLVTIALKYPIMDREDLTR